MRLWLVAWFWPGGELWCVGGLGVVGCWVLCVVVATALVKWLGVWAVLGCWVIGFLCITVAEL